MSLATTSAQIQSNLIALGFTNTSGTAIFNKIAQSIGMVIDETIQEMTNSEDNILQIITTQRYGKSGYYVAAAKAFQFGDDLTEDANGNPVYAVISTDPSVLIITQAAFEEVETGSNSELFLKVATLNSSTGLLQALSGTQLAAFISYFLNFEIPGLPITIVSSPPNQLSFNAICTYYATYDLSVLQTNLATALNEFRDNFDFDGTLFIGDLQDYIKQNVPGVRDFNVFNTTIDGQAFQGSLTLTSGYFNYIATILNNITYSPIQSI